MIKDTFEGKKGQASDINEHMDALREISSECKHITEFGVRSIFSTWAFLAGLKKGGKLVSVDIHHPSFYGGNIDEVINAAAEEGIDFEFIESDTRAIKIKKTDLLFVDTIHTYDQVKAELDLHADKARKYIAFHDTSSCPEIWPAIQELLDNGEWKLKAKYDHNNGLTIIERC